MHTENTKRSDTDDTKRVYLYTGEVDARRQSAVDDLVARLVDTEFAAFDLGIFDGNDSTAENILTAAATAPLTSQKKVVIVDRVDRLSAGEQVRIADFIPRLGAKTCLVLLTSEEELSRRRPSGSRQAKNEGEENREQRKRAAGLQPELAAAAKAHGAVVNFAKLKSDGVGTLVREALARHDKKIQPPALQALVGSAQSNPAVIESEVAKLAAYTAERDTITADDVDKVVCKSPEDRVFPLIDAIAARRPAEAIRLLHETFAASPKPDDEVPRILGLLGRHFRMLYQTRFLKNQGVKHLGSVPEKLQSMLMQERRQSPLSVTPWQKGKFLQQANSFSLEEIRGCLKQVLSCELAVKGITEEGSPRLNLEMLVLRLCRRKRTAKS